MFDPIPDVCDEVGARLGLEAYHSDLAFEIHAAHGESEAIGQREAFGFNFDPSHLHWLQVNPVLCVRAIKDRIWLVHMKDAALQLDGKSRSLASRLKFGHRGRGRDFRSLVRSGVDFEEIVRTLNHIGFDGPPWIEWERSGTEREWDAAESCSSPQSVDFQPSEGATPPSKRSSPMR